MIAIDAFAGCGGFSRGCLDAGIDVVSAIDIYGSAVETYKINNGDHIIKGNIRENEFYDQFIEPACGHDDECLVIGSPPCQGFSLAGMRDLIDPRRFLVKDYLRVVKTIKPVAFVMENVPGIMSSRLLVEHCDRRVVAYFELLSKLKQNKLLYRHKKSESNKAFVMDAVNALASYKEKFYITDALIKKNTIETIIYITNNAHWLGYKTIVKKIDAASYGVPQHRERVFVIGIAKDAGIEPCFPAADHFKHQWMSLFGEAPKQFVTTRDAIHDLEDAKENVEFSHVFTKHDEKFLKKMKSLETGESVYGTFKQSYQKIDPDKPSPCVTENHGGTFVHWKKDSRLLTPREIARLQTFPDTFKFIGTKSQVLKLIGNAVPCLLACKIVSHVKKLIEMA